MQKNTNQSSGSSSEPSKKVIPSMSSGLSDPEQNFLAILMKIKGTIDACEEPDDIMGADGKQAFFTLKKLLLDFDNKESNIAVYGLIVSQTKLLCNIVEPKLSGLFSMFSYTNTKEFIANLKLLSDEADALLPAVTTQIIEKAKKAWDTKKGKRRKKARC